MLKKIAIVEDNERVRHYMMHIMNTLYYEAIAFANGQEALTGLKEDPDIDVVITDLLMPVMTGRQLVEEMKCDFELKNKAIIIYSGVYDKVEVEDLLDESTFFIRKPFSLKKIDELLSELDTRV